MHGIHLPHLPHHGCIPEVLSLLVLAVNELCLWSVRKQIQTLCYPGKILPRERRHFHSVISAQAFQKASYKLEGSRYPRRSKHFIQDLGYFQPNFTVNFKLFSAILSTLYILKINWPQLVGNQLF